MKKSTKGLHEYETWRKTGVCNVCGTPDPSQPYYICGDCIKPFPVDDTPIKPLPVTGFDDLVKRLRVAKMDWRMDLFGEAADALAAKDDEIANLKALLPYHEYKGQDSN